MRTAVRSGNGNPHMSAYRKRLRGRLPWLAMLPGLAALLGTALMGCWATPNAWGQEPEDEIVANLAAGRVVIAVTKDAIVIATLENRIEPATRPPVIIQLGSRRAGVVLGADVWTVPSSGIELARLDKDLPALRGAVPSLGPHLEEGGSAEAVEIEQVGQGVLERLHDVAKRIHGRLDMPKQEPLFELLLVDYAAGYGPEVWLLTYNVDQAPLRGDYWETQISRPSYNQLWPPEKSQPHTLVEVSYPPEEASATLLELIRNGDSRLVRVRDGDPQMAATIQAFTQGDSRKVHSAEGIQCIRTLLGAVAAPAAGETIATIGLETGFEWVLAPPKEPEKPGQEKRPPGAPTLQRPPR
jgi:hypothetical protein